MAWLCEYPFNLILSLWPNPVTLRNVKKNTLNFYCLFCSLLKVHLQLRGFSVFLDIEKLKAGKFDDNLLNSVRNAKNFIIVLTPCTLDRCVGDNNMKDWVHRVSFVCYYFLLFAILCLVLPIHHHTGISIAGEFVGFTNVESHI